MPLSSETETRMQAIRDECARRNVEHEPGFYILVNEAQAEDLAAGYVPLVVKAMARTMLDWEDEERRRAARPALKKKRRRLDREVVQGQRAWPRGRSRPR